MAESYVQTEHPRARLGRYLRELASAHPELHGGIFFRGTNNMSLGQIDLRFTSSAGIGIRVETSGSAGSDSNSNTNLRIDNAGTSSDIRIQNIAVSGGTGARTPARRFTALRP